jgi:hypothetical protein
LERGRRSSLPESTSGDRCGTDPPAQEAASSPVPRTMEPTEESPLPGSARLDLSGVRHLGGRGGRRPRVSRPRRGRRDHRVSCGRAGSADRAIGTGVRGESWIRRNEMDALNVVTGAGAAEGGPRTTPMPRGHPGGEPLHRRQRRVGVGPPVPSDHVGSHVLRPKFHSPKSRMDSSAQPSAPCRSASGNPRRSTSCQAGSVMVSRSEGGAVAISARRPRAGRRP